MFEVGEIPREQARPTAQPGWGLEEALGAARVLLSSAPLSCKSDPRVKAWLASLESLLDFAFQCRDSASSPSTVNTVNAEAEVGVVGPEDTIVEPEPLPVEDPHDKRPMEPPEEEAGQSSNLRRRSREDLEGHAAQHLMTCCTPYPASML